MPQVRLGSVDHAVTIAVAEIRATAAVTVQIDKACRHIIAPGINIPVKSHSLADGNDGFSF